MKRSLAIMLVLAVAAVAGTAFAGVRAGTPAEQRVLATALRALRARSVSVRVSEHARQRALIFNGVSRPEVQWKAEVAAGVFAAHGFALTWIKDGSGLIRYHDLMRFGQRVPHHVAPATKQQVVASLTTAAQRAGAHLDAIEMLHPLAFAPVVMITVRNPVRFEQRGGLQRERAFQSLLDFAKPRVEGIFLIVRDLRGHVRWRGGLAVRPGIGVGDWPNLVG